MHEKLHPAVQQDSVIIGSKVLLGGELRCQNCVLNDCMYQTKYLNFKLYLTLVTDKILCMKSLYEILLITCFLCFFVVFFLNTALTLMSCDRSVILKIQ